jgi:hypothetical protein
MMKIWSKLRYIVLPEDFLDQDEDLKKMIFDEIGGSGKPAIPVYETTVKYKGDYKQFFIITVQGHFDESPDEQEWKGKAFAAWAQRHMKLSPLGSVTLGMTMRLMPQDTMRPAFVEVTEDQSVRDRLSDVLRRDPGGCLTILVGNFEDGRDKEVLAALKVKPFTSRQEVEDAAITFLAFNDQGIYN